MKKLATAVAAIALIGTPALAADIAVKAAEPSPAAVYNWTGWYAGVNAGASFGNVKTDFNAPATVQGSLSGPTTNTPSFTSLFAGSNREYPDGFIGGGQIGYNWQFSPIWVVGVEADFQGAIEKDRNTLTGNFSDVLVLHGTFILPPNGGGSLITANPVAGSTVLDYQTKIDWFGTVRARIGYVWGNGEVMS